MDNTSATLLERVRRSGEHEAWERFVRIYSPLLLFWARRAGFDEVDRADLVQEILLDLKKTIPELAEGRKRSGSGALARSPNNQNTGRLAPCRYK